VETAVFLNVYWEMASRVGGGLGDSNFRLMTIQHGSYGYGDNKSDFVYRYDRAGQITQFVTMYNEGANLSSIQDFTYDHLNRLLTAKADGSITNAKYSHNYGYDKLSNITIFGAGSAYDYAYWSANCSAPRPTQSLPHAVKTIGGQYFCYDNNGNMTKRHDGVNTYTQNFDVENRLTSVVVNGQTTGFAYDAAGLRVKTTKPNGVVIDHPFPNYEVENPTAATPLRRSTYSLAGQTIATRVSGDPVSGNNGLFTIYSDHLGSTSLVVNSGNNPVAGSRTWYLPFGGYRPNTAPTQTITDRDFTGQKENMELGLLYYQARFYVPGIGRFASADTIVPNPTNPQSLNRYSYTRNSPLNLIDPTGHRECESDGNCGPPVRLPKPTPSKPPALSDVLDPIPSILDGLPIQDATWANGFGANAFAEANPGRYLSDSAGIHPGMDFGKAYNPDCVSCNNVYSNVTGTVTFKFFTGDTDPNVVIDVGGGLYIIFGDVQIDIKFKEGDNVNSGDVIGLLVDQREYNADGSLYRDNTHVHLAARNGQRIYNPAYFFKDPQILSAFTWNYAAGESLYSMSSYVYGSGKNFWNDPTTIDLTR
jgi:RHS repeat-associated protein